MPTRFDIDIGSSGIVTGVHYAPSAAGALDTTVILAHGAGASQVSPFMTAFAEGLAKRGADAVTFNFAYMERGRRAPDPAPRLEATYRAAITTTRSLVPSAATRLVVGGKSMGGRIATQAVAGDADGLGVAGLVLLGYPLHPPGRPERRRDAHLASIDVPMLFVQGSRDTFGNEDEMRPVVDACRQARLSLVEHGDHSFKVRGKDAPSPADIHATVQGMIVDWIRQIL